jgi:hypothetical protein
MGQSVTSTRISAAIATAAAAVLLMAGTAHATPGLSPSSSSGSPCSWAGDQGVDIANCVESPDGGNNGGVSGYQVIVHSNLPVAAGATAQDVVPCPAGKKVLGGGFSGLVPEVQTYRSFPQAGNDAWIVAVENEGSVASFYDAYAICANVSS